MNTLPLALSVPHSGLTIPDEVRDICILTEQEIIKDGDEGADEIYSVLKDHVIAFQKADIARAVLDLNRATDDFRKDGIIKTHTCWDVPVYSNYPDDGTIRLLIEKYYKPYHQRLSTFSKSDEVFACIDCHTMAAYGPPVGPDPDQERPLICLGNVNHRSCPEAWIELLANILEKKFRHPVTINSPFSGGYITQHYGQTKPWIQLELSRTDAITNKEKTDGIFAALRLWCTNLFD